MNILVLGSGGREHAIIQSMSISKNCTKLYALPGNGGTSLLAQNIEGNVNDFDLIKNVVKEKNISMVFVGPEDPIVNGIYDYFKADKELNKIKIISPSKQAGLLEGSKDFAKDFMEKYNIPTARHKTFNAENIDLADSFLETMTPPYVLKADGLAAGKGVLILNDLSEAKKEIRSMIIDKKFGKSSSKVVVEEFLEGAELSCFVLTDGKTYKTLPFAKDYKKIGEGDSGLNTGGMGAISPVPFLDDEFLLKIENKIIKNNKNIFIDFNAIAKGYSVDLIRELFEEKLLENFLIEVGGELTSRGYAENNRRWKVAIQNPIEIKSFYSEIFLTNKSLATSGNYRKFRIDSITGERYNHIINPLNGEPLSNNILSASVISDSCIEADAWATSLMVMNPINALDLINEIDGIEILLLTSKNNEIFEIKSNGWDLVTQWFFCNWN